MGIEKIRIKIKRNVRSFEADDDVNLMLENAQKKGMAVGDLCNLAIRAYGGTLIDELDDHAYKIQRLSNSIKEIKKKEASSDQALGDQSFLLVAGSFGIENDAILKPAREEQPKQAKARYLKKHRVRLLGENGKSD